MPASVASAAVGPGLVPNTIASGRSAATLTIASTMPALDGSSQWRSSMMIRRGPETSMRRAA